MTPIHYCISHWFHVRTMFFVIYCFIFQQSLLFFGHDKQVFKTEIVQRGITKIVCRLLTFITTFLFCFISRHNLAFNRMTRMLANLTEVNCYNRTGLSESFINSTLLKSAKRNLLEFAFFGILDEQRKTQFLFEHTFGIRFIESFEQRKKTHVSKIDITKNMIQQIEESNVLDYDLYEFAKDLFLQRVSTMEEKLKFTVDEYFENIRDKYFKEDDDFIGDDQIDGGKMFDDESLDEAMQEKLDNYPGNNNPSQHV